MNMPIRNLDEISKKQVRLYFLHMEKEGMSSVWMANVNTAIRRFGIRTRGPAQPVRELSGGNQQKVVLAKWLATKPRILILDEPTRGIDVGAKLEVYELVNKLTDAGQAVVLVSSELPELMGMSDRILMLADGRIGGLLNKAEATQENLLAAAMGNLSARNLN
jgi:ABC-type sugar transport system ATPase subunit